jgi:radical SAM superfamily enzyme with C-terminal helix-hairpin-helix motif
LEAKIFISDKVGLDPRTVKAFVEFVQGMANRIGVGHCRYGHPAKSKRFMSRLGEEFKEYKKRGNAEQLRNVALYAALESMAPENKKFHFDNTVGSVTRGKF